MRQPPQQVPLMIATASRRIGAWLMDMLLLFIAAVVMAFLIGAGHSFQSSGGTAGIYVQSSSWLPCLLVASAAYAIPLWTLRGATLGQQALGLHVYRATQPSPLDWWHSAARWLGPFGWIVFAVASLTSGLWVNVMLLALLAVAVSMGRDPQRRFAHDRLAGSLVVLDVDPWARPY